VSRGDDSGPVSPADHVRRIVAALDPFDEREAADRAEVLRWIDSGAPLYRTRPPDEPPVHLVSYVVPVDPDRGTLLLVAHRKAGLWLPPGGHVEPGEDPWHTAVREAGEELFLPVPAVPAVPSVPAPPPAFITVTRTVGAGPHTDVSLWYLRPTPTAAVTRFDEAEFSAVAWVTPAEVLSRRSDTLDPELHRFVRKLSS
jgi:8-oxo-dGTP pyrophosphatase MutT (NUDIX family)